MCTSLCSFSSHFRYTSPRSYHFNGSSASFHMFLGCLSIFLCESVCSCIRLFPVELFMIFLLIYKNTLHKKEIHISLACIGSIFPALFSQLHLVVWLAAIKKALKLYVIRLSFFLSMSSGFGVLRIFTHISFQHLLFYFFLWLNI